MTKTSSPLAFLPIDAELVVGYDAAQVRGSALGHRFEAVLDKQLGSSREKFRAACGFDPIKTVTQLTVGVKLLPRGKVDGVVVVRGIDPARLVECLPKFDPDLVVTRDREVSILKDKAGADGPGFAAFTAVGADTVVIQTGPGMTRDSVMAIVHGGAPLRNSPTFVGLYDHLEHGASLWGVINGNSKALAELSRMGVKPRSVDGTMTVSDQVVVVGRIAVESPEEATRLASLASSTFAGAKQMFERLDATASGAVVTMNVALTGPQLDALLQMAGVH